MTFPDQRGKTVLVTGANSGLGLITATRLAEAGAMVLLACRNPQRAERARAAVAQVATGVAPQTIALDLGDLESVADAAQEIATRTSSIDVLINNAGVMAPPLSRTKQGFETQFGVNHLGHFALTGHLLPLLLQSAAPRVVTVSSVAHRFGSMHWEDLQAERSYFNWARYGQSKLANLLFTWECNRLAGAHRTDLIAVAAHPGYARTELTHNGPGDRGAKKIMAVGAKIVDGVFAQSATRGAIPQIHAATARDVVGNDYFGPDGFMEQRGNAAIRVGRTHKASDAQAAQRLWEISEDLTEVSYPWPKVA